MACRRCYEYPNGPWQERGPLPPFYREKPLRVISGVERWEGIWGSKKCRKGLRAWAYGPSFSMPSWHQTDEASEWMHSREVRSSKALLTSYLVGWVRHQKSGAAFGLLLRKISLVLVWGMGWRYKTLKTRRRLGRWWSGSEWGWPLTGTKAWWKESEAAGTGRDSCGYMSGEFCLRWLFLGVG